MAGFSAHLLFGVLTATGLVVTASVLTVVSNVTLLTLFAVTIFSSMLPDIDSNSGKPVKIIFSILALLSMVAVFHGLQVVYSFSQASAFGSSLAAAFFIYVMIQGLFKKATNHRGVFHSIPMAIIMGLLTIALLSQFHMSTVVLRLMGIGVVSGYVCHLVLDELNSAVNLSGKLLVPKKSLGTALKLTGASKLSTATLYMALSGLCFVNQTLLMHLLVF